MAIDKLGTTPSDPSLATILDGIHQNAVGVTFTEDDPATTNVPAGKLLVQDDGTNQTVSVKTGLGNIITLMAQNPKVVNMWEVHTFSKITDSTHIPFDNTKPQSTEGTQAFTLAAQASSASNYFLIFAHLAVFNDGYQSTGALFQDSGADSINASPGPFSDAVSTNVGGPIVIVHWMTTGTVASTTFKVRFGSGNGSTYLNGYAATALYGGVCCSGMVIAEIAA